MDLMRLYGASRWQILWRLQLPSALPYLLSGMKIAGGLALIGAVVAEFVAGIGTATGLAWRIVEAGNRLEIATMFAALALLALLGVAIFAALSLLEWLLLQALARKRDPRPNRRAFRHRASRPGCHQQDAPTSCTRPAPAAIR